MFIYNGKKLIGDVTICDLTYLFTWITGLATDAELAALEITRADDPILPDPSLYSYTENDDGTLNIVPLTDAQKAAYLNTISTTTQAQIDAAYAEAMNAITATYPATEIASWPKQEIEARAYAANNTTPTPLLSALSAARGIAVSDLAARVIAKADAYVVYAGACIGRRQARQDAIAAAVAANNLSALQAVVW